MSNIAEGFERGGSNEFIQFLYTAKGSCGEVRAQLRIACDQGYIQSGEHDRLHDLARQISGMISNFINHLQFSGYKGEKLNRVKRREVEAFQERQKALREAQLVNMRRMEAQE